MAAHLRAQTRSHAFRATHRQAFARRVRLRELDEKAIVSTSCRMQVCNGIHTVEHHTFRRLLEVLVGHSSTKDGASSLPLHHDQHGQSLGNTLPCSWGGRNEQCTERRSYPHPCRTQWSHIPGRLINTQTVVEKNRYWHTTSTPPSPFPPTSHSFRVLSRM